MNNVFNSSSYCRKIVSGKSSDWFYLILKWSFRIILCKFKHEFDLVLALSATIWLAHDGEFVRTAFFDCVKLIQVNVF